MRDGILVTGALGFIGSAYTRRLLERGEPVITVDLNTYAGDPRRLPEPAREATIPIDVASEDFWKVVHDNVPRLIVHFAAETHVTRSEFAPEHFFHSNVEGTRWLFKAAAHAGAGQVVHISTDEVYGPCADLPFRETDKRPGEGLATSAYARSKSIADDIACSFASRIPTIVVRLTNCFGPWQHPEKAVARWVSRALTGEELPVWGDGGQVRDWMYVEDACNGLDSILSLGEPGEVYNLAPEGGQRTNYEVATTISIAAGRSEESVYLTTYDRPQHDRRYAIDSSKLRGLGWKPSIAFEDGIDRTVEWYDANRDWWLRLVTDAESLYRDSERRTAG